MTRLWPYTQNWRYPVRRGDPRLLDPVNLHLPDVAPEALLAAIARRGWSRPQDGAVHRTWIDGRLRRMADHTALGPTEERFHLRVWPLGSGSIAAAHHEYRDADGHHRVTSWDAARDRAASDLVAGGFSPLPPTEPLTEPNLRGLPNDGRVARLMKLTPRGG